MNHLELFAGIGGFRMAMDHIQSEGLMTFQNVAFSEIDKHATVTYKANFDTSQEIEIGDIVEFTKDKNKITNLPDFDILTGGFPCQSFSLMGAKKGFEDERGQLFFRIMDIIRIKHPRYLLLENVKNLFTHHKGQTFKRIVNELEAEGYTVKYDIFNSADFKLPQTRKRVLIFATQDNIDFEFNTNVVKKCFDENKERMSIRQVENVLGVLSKEVPIKYLLSEKIKPTILSDGSANFKSKSEINQLIARPLTATMHKMHRACQDNYYSLDFIQSDGKINPALTMSKEELAKIPIRKLTPREAIMIQGFPKDFSHNANLAGVSDGALYKQAGNAVSVNTIYAVLYYLIVNNIILD
ncbi:DNA cytosine methyltransferase [Macellibacteroides fermentans]|uniref:Cytosine-specific methyltransferase n=1 Tax=Parabacteroides chartae TaxID=1037355 RepID=A0A1T5BFN0_9BACT|nr:DNA (cytosine-5-)-methyltransferase [Parabacteroides chartae]SKB46104.1 DNA (cytosine-5)-methyltransferase 1 [Parabacteroides chartae]